MEDPLAHGTCQDCKEQYTSLGKHIAQSSCDYPELTSRQKQILRGALLGDGNIDFHNNGYPRYRLGSVEPKFLSWFSDEIYNIVNKKSVRIQHSDDDPNHQDYYMLRTISHPYFKKLRTWYESGSKILPKDVLTPMELKMWYVTDGGLSGGTPTLRLDNERSSIYEHKENFEQIGISPTVVDDERQLNFLESDWERLFEYMGAPVPGFEYKWDVNFPDESVRNGIERVK
jgi:LAGLIDADG DNA endonuclease family.